MATMTAVLPGQIQAEPKGYNERDATSETMDTQTARSALNMVRYFVADRNPEHEQKSKAPRRRSLRHLRELMLEDFLKTHGFSDVNEPRQSGCFSFKERLFPLHVAAKCGDHEMVRILLQAGADRWAKTSKGWTALELADRQRNQIAADMLRCDTRTLTVSQFSKAMTMAL
ncbi:Tnks2 [Symbiodinium natans]|uniref:Tnks2 protein n=1 Tax=Symbiodinium natans TaxID=878477 RepID=A0A812HZU9_9DINO|nr:Tnks2 [Symbiodinium natans]